MSLNSALSIATGGLANINAQFALISQNVANAATPSYAVEVGTQTALTADGVGLGVQTGPATLQINQTLQSASLQQNATVTGLTTTQTALQAIDTVLGTPGSGTDIGSLLGNLKNSFSTLLNDPSSQTQQSAVVSSAATLAQGINSLSAAYTAQRQAAQTDLGSAVTTLNSTLATIGQLNSQIVTMQQAGQSTADLENQRNASVATLSQLINVQTVQQPDGSIDLYTASGLSLPTQGGSTTGTGGPFSIAGGNAQPGAYYPGGGLPGITPERRRRHQPDAGRPDRRRHHAARHHAADGPGGAGRVLLRPGQPVLRPGPDPVHRPERQRANRRRHPGAVGLCRLRGDDPGQPGGDRRAEPGARRDQRHRRQRHRGLRVSRPISHRPARPASPR